MAIQYPERYPFDAAKHVEFLRGRSKWFDAWRAFGELTGIWWPFLRWAERAGLLFDE